MNCEVTTVNEMTRIAVDAIGGDFGAPVVLEGVEMALAEDPNLEVVICGPADAVEPFAQSHDRCIAQPCTEEIAMDEHPAQAVRKKKDSSIVVGCRLVKEGQAQGFFSAGSTGACLTAATLVMGASKGHAPRYRDHHPVSRETGRHVRCGSERRLQAFLFGAVRPDGGCLCRTGHRHS